MLGKVNMVYSDNMVNELEGIHDILTQVEKLRIENDKK